MINQEYLLLDNYLNNALSSYPEVSNKAISNIDSLIKENFYEFLLNLTNIFANENIKLQKRELAGLLIKNILLYNENCKFDWKFNFLDEEKETIRKIILEMLPAKKLKIRSIVAILVSTFFILDEQIRKEILMLLITNTKKYNIYLRLGSLQAIAFICEEIMYYNIIPIQLEDILQCIIDIINNNDNKNVLIQALNTLYYLIPLLTDSFSPDDDDPDIIMEAILGCIVKYSNNIFILEKVALIFIQIVSTSEYYDALDEYSTNIIKSSLDIIRMYYSKNKKMTLLYIEILCSIGEEELKRDNDIKNKSIKPNRGYFNPIWEQTKIVLLKVISQSKDDETESEWNISNAGLHVLQLMVDIIKPQNALLFFNELNNLIRNNIDSEGSRYWCWFLLNNFIDSIHEEIIKELVSKYYYVILGDINPNRESKLINIASTLFRETIWFFKEESTIEEVIDKILPIINYVDRESTINICIIISNLIKLFGDSLTQYNSTPISPYFDEIFQELFINIDTIGDSQIFYYRHWAISDLIFYSSLNQQSSIIRIMNIYLNEINNSLKNYKIYIAKGITHHQLYECECAYFLVLITLIEKNKTSISSEEAKKIWILTEFMFKLSNKNFPNGHLVIKVIAKKVKEEIVSLYEKYNPYMMYALQSRDEELSNSGYVSLIEIISCLIKINPFYCETFINLLKGLSVKTDLSLSNALIVTQCLGLIGRSLKSNYRDYLLPVMKSLFNLCQLSLLTIDEEDEDLKEKVIALRNVLVNEIASIHLVIKVEHFLVFIPQVIFYFRQFIEDKIQNEEIIKNILYFLIDYFTSSGRKEDIEFAKLASNKLKEYSNPENSTLVIKLDVIIVKKFYKV